jgi:hypothetical protein
MMLIAAPTSPAGHPDRSLDCQMAAERAFRKMADDIETAGWTGDDVAVALLGLALAHIRGREADGESTVRLEDAMAAALESIGEGR